MARQLFRFAIGTAIVLGVLLLGPHVALAQRGAISFAPRVSAIHARPASTGTAGATRSRGISAAPRTPVRSHISRNDSLSGGGSLNGFSFTGPAGIGFANSGLSNEDLGIKAAIDPATQWRIYQGRLRSRNQGFSGGGYYLLGGGGYYAIPSDSGDSDQASQQQSQQSDVEQAPPSEQYAEAPPQSEPEEASDSLPDVGELVLVLRNGTQIEAVAFTRMNDRIVYITEDGSRRTLALADLNSDETERVNQERGTPLQFPL